VFENRRLAPPWICSRAAPHDLGSVLIQPARALPSNADDRAKRGVDPLRETRDEASATFDDNPMGRSPAHMSSDPKKSS